jgi:UDP-sulfoquinovose synthase
MTERLEAYRDNLRKNLVFRRGDLKDYNFVLNCLRAFEPDAIVHLGENPSAPYSMIDVEHCNFTHMNNLMGTLNILYAMKEACPKAHLVKLGTMGEYGTPNIPIPEGFFEIEYRGKKDYLPFPRQAGSWYHQTKVHDSNNIMMACRLWGIRVTDIMQGVVFGTRIDEMGSDERLLTRLDFDQCFGTAVNRYCC